MQALTKCVPYQNFTTHVDIYNLTMLHCFEQTLSSVTTKQYCKCRLSPNVHLTYQNFTTHVHTILQYSVLINHFLNFIKNHNAI